MKDFHQHLHESFSSHLDRLNSRQREAVKQIEGPVLVLAGPGTGKTQILAARIGNILVETDTDPRQILCLTYTDTGRVEMRNRLFKLIGPAAYRIPIHTFHSFCNEVIQDNPSWFGKHQLEPVSELEEIELFKNLLDRLEPENPLKRFRGDIFYEIRRLRELFSRMKKEAWTPEFLEARIDAYLAGLPTRDGFFYKRNYREFSAGDPRQGRISEETERMEKLRAGVRLFPVYTTMMQEQGRYTFDDMIVWVMNAFATRESMLLDYQERYLYFLVDEFQDTSGSQNKLLQYLTGYWELPNVFVVGDDDQSIFSFQDANVENIRQFANRYKAGIARIVLTENYRSSQPILDAARMLIENNTERIIRDDASLDKTLVSSNTEVNRLTAPPRIVVYPDPLQETVCVAGKIMKLIARGAAPGDIAVIYRNHKQAALLADWLVKKKVGINMKRSVNLLELPFVRNILRLLEYLYQENTKAFSGEDILFEILHYEFFDVPALEIAAISAGVAADNQRRKNGSRSFIRQAIAAAPEATPQLFGETEVNPVKSASRILESLIAKMRNLTLQGLLEEVIRQAGVLKYVMESDDKIWLLQVLHSLFDFVKEETKKRPLAGVRELLELTRLMNDNDIALPVQKIDTSADGVHLVTAHGAKGAEYKYVFLIGCLEKIWDDKNGGNRQSFKLPDNLSDHAPATGELEESRRLFYVAVTRAKAALEISYAARDTAGKDQVRSSFVSEIMDGASLPCEEESASPEQLAASIALEFAVPPVPQIALLDQAHISRLLSGYTLSVTHLNNYLSCPVKFYYQNLIRVPAAKSDSMTFGSAVHFALQRLFEKMKEAADVFPGSETLVNDFAWYMERNRESFTTDQFNRRMEYGALILPSYYNFYHDRWNKAVRIEWNIRQVEIMGVPVNGKLDKIETGPEGVNVVDYKTGKYENAKKKLKRPDAADPLGGDYWRQAVFYKLLLDNDSRAGIRTRTVEFDFIEPVKEEYKTEKIEITPSDIEIVTAQVKEVWEKIGRHEFSTGCGKEDCHWCNFVKDNKLSVPLHQLAEAAEEEV